MPETQRILRPDGSIWTIDTEGNVLDKKPPSVGGEELGIAERTWKDPFREYVSPFLRSATVTAGGAGGAIAGTGTGGPGPGTIAGLLLGGTAGDLAYQQAQRFDPKLFGAPPGASIPESITEAVLNAGLEATFNKALPAIGRKVSTGIREGMPGIAGKMFPSRATPMELESLLKEPKIDFDIAQGRQSRAAAVGRDVLATGEAEEEFLRQQTQLGGEVEDLVSGIAGKPRTLATSTAERATEAHAKALSYHKIEKATEGRLWKHLEEGLIPRIREKVFRVGGKGKKAFEMEAPVPILKVNEFASRIFKQIENQLEDPGLSLTKESRTALNSLRDTLRPFVDTPLNRQQQPVISYQDAQWNKIALSDVLKDAPTSVKKRYTKLAQALRNQLSSDINAAFDSWGEPYKTAREVAKNKTISNAAKFGNAIGKNVVNEYDSPDIIQEKVLNEALSSVQKARQYIKATGSRSELGEELVRRIFNSPSVRDTTTGYFNGSQGLNMYRKLEDIAKVPLTAPQRAGIVYLLNRMQAIDPTLHNTGKIAFTIRHIGAMIGLTGGTAAALQTGSLSAGLYTAGGIVFVAVPMGKKFVRDVIMNPKLARQLAIMSKNPVGSHEANVATRLVIRALNGARAYIQYQGQNLPAEIQNGKLRLLEESDESVEQPPGFLENIGSWVQSGI